MGWALGAAVIVVLGWLARRQLAGPARLSGVTPNTDKAANEVATRERHREGDPADATVRRDSSRSRSARGAALGAAADLEIASAGAPGTPLSEVILLINEDYDDLTAGWNEGEPDPRLTEGEEDEHLERRRPALAVDDGEDALTAGEHEDEAPESDSPKLEMTPKRQRLLNNEE